MIPSATADEFSEIFQDNCQSKDRAWKQIHSNEPSRLHQYV